MFFILGEAEYVDDMDLAREELYGSFVQTTVAKADLDVVDPSEALVMLYFSVVHFQIGRTGS